MDGDRFKADVGCQYGSSTCFVRFTLGIQGSRRPGIFPCGNGMRNMTTRSLPWMWTSVLLKGKNIIFFLRIEVPRRSRPRMMLCGMPPASFVTSPSLPAVPARSSHKPLPTILPIRLVLILMLSGKSRMFPAALVCNLRGCDLYGRC